MSFVYRIFQKHLSPMGMTYNPFTGQYALGRNTDVNYLLHTVKNV